MKKHFVLVAPLILIECIMGCSKHTKSKPTGSTRAVNPVTATAVCDFNFNDTLYTNHGWTKTFEDNFDAGLSNWNVLTGGVKTELECNEPGNVQIANGVLQITAKQESVVGPKTVGNDTTQSFNYTSGWITSNTALASASASTPKVRIVARIKMASGYGLTSLFYGYGGNWPVNGEIDYFSVAGDDTKEYVTSYNYGTQPGVNLVSGAALFNPATLDLSTCYHVYTTEWTQNALLFYLDGQLVETKTSGGHIPDLFGKSHFLSLSVPVGGEYYSSLNLANIHVGAMSVDYVKVFTSN